MNNIKRIILLLFFMLLLVSVAVAETSTAETTITEPRELIPYAVALVAAILSFALGRFMKIKIDIKQIMPVLTAIIQACFKTEEITLAAGKPQNVQDYDEYRAQMAARELKNELQKSEQRSTLRNVFGTTIKAVKTVFPLIKPIMAIVKK